MKAVCSQEELAASPTVTMAKCVHQSLSHIPRGFECVLGLFFAFLLLLSVRWFFFLDRVSDVILLDLQAQTLQVANITVGSTSKNIARSLLNVKLTKMYLGQLKMQCY